MNSASVLPVASWVACLACGSRLWIRLPLLVPAAPLTSSFMHDVFVSWMSTLVSHRSECPATVKAKDLRNKTKSDLVKQLVRDVESVLY